MYKVYYTTQFGDNGSFEYESDQMVVALNKMQELRSTGHRFVTMASENNDQVGKVGVNAVKDGKLPDGNDYDWTKRDRVGAAFKTPE